MPSLKQISCCIQWADTTAPFQEYGTQYGDGVVESFIVVPSHPQGFCIRLTSRGYIADGLAMVVFVDGNYQCNRLRLNLLPPKKGRPANRTEVDFLLRQQEKPQGDGIYLGRAWRFDNHNIVQEAPEGFQAGHFDDLGTIEVLVLRCRARDRADADYEGSSSGEDSDIFEDRPAREEEDEEAPPAATTTTTAVSAPAIPAAAEPEDDGMMGGMFGLFDGANDMYDPSNRRSGQWVWHQKERPQAVPPDYPPALHAVPDTRFRTTSYVPPNTYYQPQQIPHYPTVPSSHSSKQVHFDFGRQPPQDQYSRRSDRQAYPAQQRPVSRERVRSTDQRKDSSPIPQAPPPEPYSPQSMSPKTNNQTYSNQSNVSQQQSTRRQKSAPQNHRDEPREAWTSNDAVRGEQKNNQDQSGANRANHQSNQSAHYSQPTQQSQPAYNNQQSYPQSQQTNLRDQYVYQSQNPLPHLNQATHLPQYVQYQSPEYYIPPPPQFQPILHTSNVSHMLPQGHIYPPPVMLPQEYVQHGSYPYPFWSHYNAGPIAYPQQQEFQDSHGMTDQVSPKNNALDDVPSNHNGRGTPPPIANQQSPPNGNTDWQNDTNNTNATNGDANQDGTDNWNNTVDNQDTNDGGWNKQDANDTTNAGDDAWADTNNNSNDNSNNANSAWETNEQNNITAKNGWDNDASNNNNNGSSDSQQPNGDFSGAQQSKPDLVAPANAARDLYGPHGPYYSFRAFRVDEPKPDAQEEPRYDVPKAIALERSSTKQVQPGPGYRYYKRKLEPEYIDTMDTPYARFVFKYRTKEQLPKEIGITVDVEPTGDQGIQELQNLDKQTLVEMLLRAKTALGGKVPSPPPTPTTSASTSGPVALEAPKLPYLKYSLPELRPSNFSKNSTPSNSAGASKTSLVGKENIAPAQNSSNDPWTENNSANNSGDWNNDSNANNNNTNSNNWVAKNSPAQSNASKPSNQIARNSNSNSDGSRQTSKSSGNQRAPAVEVRAGASNSPPPRPPTPDNWDAAAPNNGVADAWGQGSGQQQPQGDW